MTTNVAQVAVISVAHGDGDARVERQVNALLEENCRVAVHALDPGTTTDQRAERCLRPRCGPLARVYRAYAPVSGAR